MRNLILLTCLFLLVGGGALLSLAASDLPTWDNHLEANGDCLVGNLNDPQGAPLAGYFDGHQMIAYFISPGSQCSCDEGGFKLESVNHLLYFDDQNVPASLAVRAGLLAAEYDAASGTWVPGHILCESTPVIIPIDQVGLQQVQVPTADCEALPLDDNYFLFLAYEEGVPAALAVDGFPEPGIEYLDRGNGWEDMFYFPDKSGGGKHIVWGDILCSAPVVPADQDSWGSIKAMYR